MIRLSAFFFLFIFTFQVMDVPPAKSAHNTKTCCGRMVCLCHHGKGKPCDFHKIKKSVTAAPAPHSHCALKKANDSETKKKVASKNSDAGVAFSKAPCGTDSPKSIVRGYSKDYIFPFKAMASQLTPQQLFLNPESYNLPAIREHGIDHPPQLFALSI